MTFVIKRNDTSPGMQATLKNGSGTAVDLTGATVLMIMRPVGGGKRKISGACTLHDAANGIVRYAWVSGDTDTAGLFNVEFQVTYADSTVETFPNKGYEQVQIDGDL